MSHKYKEALEPRQTSFNLKGRSKAKLLGLAVILGVVLLVARPHRAYAFVPAFVPPDQLTQMAQYDSPTNGGSSCLATPANLYQYLSWISLSGDSANDQTVTVPSNTSSINLQLNQLIFLCHRIVSPPNTIFKNDGSGNPYDGTPTGAALTQSYTHVNTVTPTAGPPAFIAPTAAGVTTTITHDNSTRFWYAQNAQFTYNTTTPLVNNTAAPITVNISVTLNATYYNSFNNGASFICVVGGGSTTNPLSCPPTTIPYNLQITVLPAPGATVSGHAGVQGGGNLAGVQVTDCNGQTTTTDANGNYSFNEPINGGFCLRVAGGSPTGYDGPFDSPAGEGYGTLADCPVNGGPPGHCPEQTYEFQVAGGKATVAPSSTYDRTSDAGYNFVYLALTAATAPTCAVTTSASPSPGQPYTVTGAVTNRAQALALAFPPYVATLTTPSGASSPTLNPNPIQPGSTATFSSRQNAPGPGTYTVRLTISGPGITPISCSNTFTTAYRPYLSVYGGDVSAGAGTAAGTACTPDPGAGIIAWNRDGAAAPNPYTGAGTEFGAQALSNIVGFASAQGGGGQGKGLSFANTNIAITNPSADAFGGQFGSVPCAHDYFGDHPTVDSSSGLNCEEINTGDPDPHAAMYHIGNLASLASGDYYYDVNDTNCSNGFGPIANSDAQARGVKGLWIDASLNNGVLEPGHQLKLYVKGNVLIDAGPTDGNIVYDTAGWSILNKPSLQLIVQGNIYIDTGIKQLDGLYVAQPDSSGASGNIYDCTKDRVDQLAPDDTTTTIDSECSGNQLVVNGAFIASRFYPMRTSTTDDIGQSDGDVSGAGHCTSSPCTATHAGEIFNYGPELWIMNNNSSSDAGGLTINAITGLPPVL